MGFEEATPVQAAAIPPILENKDILAVAQTGTGKTAAFLLPILNKLTLEPNKGIDTIILEPTRELAIQVDRQLEGFSYFTPVSSLPVYGGRDGQSMEQEIRAMKRGADIIVATPGRLISHLQMGYMDLSTVRHLILDEADRMLDMGFVFDISKIANMLPRERQTLLFSATMPNRIRQFAKKMLRNPVEVNLAVSKPAEGITQVYYRIEDEQKNRLVEHLLRQKSSEGKRVLIFAGTKRKVKDLAATLNRHGIQAGAIHSDLDQDAREQQMREFRGERSPILVATDILSRGIDVKGIHLVINFDVPSDGEDYIHRIGRTARADATGLAMTFVNRRDQRKFRRIEELMEMRVPKVPIPPEVGGEPTDDGREGRRGGRGNQRRKRGGRGRGNGGERNSGGSGRSRKGGGGSNSRNRNRRKGKKPTTDGGGNPTSN